MRMKSNILFIKLLMVAIIVYVFLFYLVMEVLFSSNRFKMAADRSEVRAVNLSHVIVHLDLKGAPPKLQYLMSLLPKLKKRGATGLLVEYEDMFPYEGKLANLSATNCYNRNELAKFVKSAISNGLDVIPLVQTFGHLESVLKLQEFKHLREEPNYPDSICPSRVESRMLITHMLEQVLEFHQQFHPVNFLHIGCDEVYHINTCAACNNRMLVNEHMFLQHVIVTSADIKRKHPNTTVLIWDDMLRSIPPLLLKQYSLRAYVEPVIWDYKPHIDISHMIIFKYYNNFENIWIASAYKGAHKKATILPDFRNRLRNHLSWMRFIDGYKIAGSDKDFNFKGIFLTGWSRFSHFDPLCELLPGSLHSLLACLMTVQIFTRNSNADSKLYNISGEHYEKVLLNVIKVELNCTGLEFNEVNNDLFADECNFKEYELFKVMSNLSATVNVIKDRVDNLYYINGDFLDVNVKTKYVNPNEISRIYHAFQPLLLKTNEISADLTNKMGPYYDYEIIKEYINNKMFNLKEILTVILAKAESLRKVQSWQRRLI